MTDSEPTDSEPTDPASGAAPGTAPSRRGYPVGAIVLLALAAAAMWGASRLTWVTVSSTDGLTEPRTDELDGGEWFGALTPLALVLLAAVAAVLATRGWARRVVGILIGLVAAVTAVPAFAVLTGSGAIEGRAATLAELPGRATVTEVVTAPLPAWLTMIASVVTLGAAVLLARMPNDTARLSGKYDNPVSRRAAATERLTEQRDTAAPGLSERVLWDALDAGADPTDTTNPRTVTTNPETTTPESGERARGGKSR